GRRRPRPPRSRRLAPDARVAGRRLALRVVARFSFHPDHLPLLDVKVLGCSENRHGRRPFKAQTVQVNPETTVEPCGGSGTCHFRVTFIKWHFASANSQANHPDLLLPELELTYGTTDRRTRLLARSRPTALSARQVHPATLFREESAAALSDLKNVSHWLSGLAGPRGKKKHGREH